MEPTSLNPAPELNGLESMAWNFGLRLKSCRPKEYAQRLKNGTLREYCQKTADAAWAMTERLDGQGVDPEAVKELVNEAYLVPKSESQETWEAGGTPEDGDSLTDSGKLLRARPTR